MFTENKITEFTKTVADLPDRPQMTAQALKEHFDSSAEELRVRFNALIDELDAFAKGGFAAVSYSGQDGKLTFTFGDGSTQTIDLPLELLIESGHYDAESESIVLTLANGDALTIPVSDLIDTYTADEKTLTQTGNTFSVKDGVFATEAPVDGALYARKDGDWKAIIEGLPHIRLSEADGITAGLYIVDDAFADWAADTSENPLSGALLIVGAELYGEDYENSATHQMLVLPCGELWWRCDEGVWQSVVPSLAGYAKTGELNTAIAGVKRDRKLKLLKTITLEEDVEQINVDFETPLDEIAILFDVAFLKEESDKAMAARTDGGGWYMFWAGGAMKTNKKYFFVHSKEYAERCWETFASGAFFGGTQGISNSTTTPKLIMSRRTSTLLKSKYVKDLNIFIPQNTSENAFAAGSTIEIWGHEADEE